MIAENPIAAESVAWSTPTGVLDLVEDEIHIWRASLEYSAGSLRLEGTLAKEEKERAARFHFARDRESFVASRGILRSLIGAYLKKPPSGLRFQYGLEGKPSMYPSNSALPIRFNLSHANGMAVYAFACGREVGIDIETIRPDFVREDVADHFFSAKEAAQLRSLPPELQAAAFFNCWTRKEAYVKARGGGLQIPLHDFDVTLAPGAPAQFLRGIDSRWNLTAFTPEANWAAALVFDGPPCKFRFFSFSATECSCP